MYEQSVPPKDSWKVLRNLHTVEHLEAYVLQRIRAALPYYPGPVGKTATDFINWLQRNYYLKVAEVRRLKMQLEKLKEDEEKRPAPQLYAVTGDKYPPGYNWLSELDEGTHFLTRRINSTDASLFEYVVLKQGNNWTKLFLGGSIEVVDPVRFSGVMEKHAVIGVETFE